MTTSDQQDEHERNAAESLIAETPRFDGVDTVRIELGTDHTGDPSMWIVFQLQPGLAVDASWVKAFNEYTTKLSLKLLHNGLTRFPYTRLEQAA